MTGSANFESCVELTKQAHNYEDLALIGNGEYTSSHQHHPLPSGITPGNGYHPTTETYPFK